MSSLVVPFVSPHGDFMTLEYLVIISLRDFDTSAGREIIIQLTGCKVVNTLDINFFVGDYVKGELLILIPVLYFIGMMLKRTNLIDDTLIPTLLGVCGVLMALVWVTGTSGMCLQSVFVGITQGILCAGCAVYVNQLIIQHGKTGGE